LRCDIVALVPNESVFYSLQYSLPPSDWADRVLGAATMFEQLLLPPPRINILGLPEWDFSAQQVKKAYREVIFL
jgi:hypothetical protein